MVINDRSSHGLGPSWRVMVTTQPMRIWNDTSVDPSTNISPTCRLCRYRPSRKPSRDSCPRRCHWPNPMQRETDCWRHAMCSPGRLKCYSSDCRSDTRRANSKPHRGFRNGGIPGDTSRSGNQQCRMCRTFSSWPMMGPSRRHLPSRASPSE